MGTLRLCVTAVLKGELLNFSHYCDYLHTAYRSTSNKKRGGSDNFNKAQGFKVLIWLNAMLKVVSII